MQATQEWFTVEEAAEYLRLSRRTIYKFVKVGRLSAYRIGNERHLRFRRQGLDRVPVRLNHDRNCEPEET